jgi:glycosyltransferase involved in cell wall biosynthesis
MGADRELQAELAADLTNDDPEGIGLFLINGDEVEPILSHLGPRRARLRRTVVIPMWELSRYPESWARQLERFDEVWAPSVFVRDAIASCVNRPVSLVPCSTGVGLGPTFGRRHFDIPESPYTFLVAFDLRSYQDRKNPFAAVAAFAEVIRTRPARDVMLVFKVTGCNERQKAADDFHERLAKWTDRFGRRRVHLIERELTDTETKSLVRCCDCLVSLHRSEGLGRFLAEAMWLGRPVIGTAYSGNVDFMTPDVSCLVNYRLVPVGPDAYPFWEDQVWAEPDLNEAVDWMIRLADEPGWGRQLGERARVHIRTHFSYRAIGLRYLEQIRGSATHG